MSKDKYLYHYTTVDTLALIFQNRTIRFKSLDQMDDYQEKYTADIKNIGQFCYISCWTDESKENKFMWKKYTDMNNGVRIKLKRNPFKRYDCTASEFNTGLNMTLKGVSNNDSIKMIMPLDVMIAQHFLVKPLSGNILYQVQYTEDKNKLYPQLSYQDDKYTGIKFDPFGKYKNTSWQYQKEWRYIFYIVPLPEKSSNKGTKYDSYISYLKMKNGKAKQPFSYYDLKLAEDAFVGMEITMSPLIEENNKNDVYDLVKEYNPDTKVNTSHLVGSM